MWAFVFPYCLHGCKARLSGVMNVDDTNPFAMCRRTAQKFRKVLRKGEENGFAGLLALLVGLNTSRDVRLIKSRMD